MRIFVLSFERSPNMAVGLLILMQPFSVHGFYSNLLSVKLIAINLQKLKLTIKHTIDYTSSLLSSNTDCAEHSRVVKLLTPLSLQYEFK
uniref:Uncharacterized protein n=1 Tax=Ixodes scapularis TaxID=6945 RepID=A0A4D5RXS9_IXOSC